MHSGDYTKRSCGVFFTTAPRLLLAIRYLILGILFDDDFLTTDNVDTR